jgi:mannose-6-phosphate isomerase
VECNRPAFLTDDCAKRTNMELRQAKPDPCAVDLAPFSRRITKPWGWEIVWAESQTYTGKLLHVFAGRRLSLQYHDEKTETQCLVSGSAVLVAEDATGTLQEIAMEQGKGYTIHPFQTHRLIAIEDSEIVEVSTVEAGTTVRLEDDYHRADETESMRALANRGWPGELDPLPEDS